MCSDSLRSVHGSLALLAYTACVLPYRLAFGRRALSGLDLGSALSTVELLIDVFFVADMARSARTAYYDENGTLVVDSRAVLLQYVRGWFALDLIATFPIVPLGQYESVTQLQRRCIQERTRRSSIGAGWSYWRVQPAILLRLVVVRNM